MSRESAGGHVQRARVRRPPAAEPVPDRRRRTRARRRRRDRGRCRRGRPRSRRGPRTAAPRRWSSRPPPASRARRPTTRARGSPCRPRPARGRHPARCRRRAPARSPRPARTTRASSGRRSAHSALTGTPSACAIRSTDPTLGRARPRSSWLRNGCESSALWPSAFSVSPRSCRSSRTRAPRQAAVSVTLMSCSPSRSTVFQSIDLTCRLPDSGRVPANSVPGRVRRESATLLAPCATTRRSAGASCAGAPVEK